jgi:hypothetical protein
VLQLEWLPQTLRSDGERSWHTDRVSNCCWPNMPAYTQTQGMANVTCVQFHRKINHTFMTVTQDINTSRPAKGLFTSHHHRSTQLCFTQLVSGEFTVKYGHNLDWHAVCGFSAEKQALFRERYLQTLPTNKQDHFLFQDNTFSLGTTFYSHVLNFKNYEHNHTTTSTG